MTVTKEAGELRNSDHYETIPLQVLTGFQRFNVQCQHLSPLRILHLISIILHASCLRCFRIILSWSTTVFRTASSSPSTYAQHLPLSCTEGRHKRNHRYLLSYRLLLCSDSDGLTPCEPLPTAARASTTIIVTQIPPQPPKLQASLGLLLTILSPARLCTTGLWTATHPIPDSSKTPNPRSLFAPRHKLYARTNFTTLRREKTTRIIFACELATDTGDPRAPNLLPSHIRSYPLVSRSSVNSITYQPMTVRTES
ncbi:hypothetical protein C8R42DRAFT_114402 [Lentinula raphanica]|nr:hypothetical protein C8R42DRAFT_114402 [Lentinula raphanica]